MAENKVREKEKWREQNWEERVKRYEEQNEERMRQRMEQKERQIMRREYRHMAREKMTEQAMGMELGHAQLSRGVSAGTSDRVVQTLHRTPSLIAFPHCADILEIDGSSYTELQHTVTNHIIDLTTDSDSDIEVYTSAVPVDAQSEVALDFTEVEAMYNVFRRFRSGQEGLADVTALGAQVS